MLSPAVPSSSVSARLHGVPQLFSASGAPLALERKQALLLAYLWLEGPTPRGKLAGLLWPDAAEARARGNLRQRLAVLRQSAGADLVLDQRGVLALSPQLAVEPATADSAPLLAAFDYADCEAGSGWLEGQREAQRSRQRAGLLGSVRAAVQAGQLDEALRLADQLLGLDRESEEAYRTQMEVLYLRGDNAAAIAVWDRCKDVLRQLYGVLPSATTRQLGETILAAAASEVAAGAARGPESKASALPVTVLRPPRLIGREPALARAVAGWRGGATLCVSGEAGLGKSRLLAEFAAAVGPCASAAARPGDAAVPYASFSRLLLAAVDRFEPTLKGGADAAAAAALADLREAARLLPRLAALLPDLVPLAVQTEYERRQCLRAAARVLAACMARGCRALLFDDLHFADPASVEAVVEMIDAADDASHEAMPNPLRFVFGARSDELGGAAAVLFDAGAVGGRAAHGADVERLVRIALQPLDRAGVAELVASLALPGIEPAAFAQRLWQQVGGNPAFVLESVKLVLALGGPVSAAAGAAAAGASALPLAPDIIAVIERRIGLLSPQARHLAQLAAIAGDSYSVPLAAAALACAPLALSEPLRELELRQVLYGRQFVHDVIAVAVKRTVAQSVAEFMHRFVADYLAQHGGEAAQIAGHWQACGEPGRAGEAYAQAARAAALAQRPVEQCQLFDAAAACFEAAGDIDALFDVLDARQDIAEAPDRAATRLLLLERMEKLAHTEEQQLRALLFRQGWETDHSHTASVQAGLAAAQRALALGLPAVAYGFGRSNAWRLAMNGHEAEATQALEAHRPWVMAHGTATQRGEFFCALSGVLGFCDHLLPAIAEARHAVAELRASGQFGAVLPRLSNMGLFLHWRGDLDAAKAVLTEAAQLRDRLHGGGSSLVIDLHLGAVLRDLGEYTAAERLLQSVIDAWAAQWPRANDLRTDAVIAENHLAQLWLALGQPQRALGVLASDDAELALRFRGRRIALKLRVARRYGGESREGGAGHDTGSGRPGAALLAEAQAMVAAHDSPFNRAVLELEVACALPPAKALALCERLLTERAPLERPGLLMHAAARAAEAALALGDIATASRHAAQVQALQPGCAPFDIERAEVAAIVASVQRASGHGAAAGDTLRAAAAWLRQTAGSGVAEPWRHGFLRGNPANVQVLAALAAKDLPTAALIS